MNSENGTTKSVGVQQNVRESLSAFFEDLGLDDFVAMPEALTFNMSWEKVELPKLDGIVMKAGKFTLMHAKFESGSEGYCEIMNPRFICKGVEYVFCTAIYDGKQFMVQVFYHESQVADWHGEFSVSDLRRIMEIPSLPEICKEFTPKPKNLIGYLLSPFRPTYVVRIKQFWAPELTHSAFMPYAYAKVEISRPGKDEVMFRDVIPWPMFADPQMLLLQLYTLSKLPGYDHAEWQSLMEEFCYSFTDFSPPTAMWFGRGYED